MKIKRENIEEFMKLADDNIKTLDVINATVIKENVFQLVIKNSVKLEQGYMLYLFNSNTVEPNTFCARIGLPNGFFGIIKEIDEVEDVLLIDVEYDNDTIFDISKIEKVVLYEKTPVIINI